MGSLHSKQQKILRFDLKEWVPENYQSNNNFLTLKNIHTGQLIDQYKVDLSTESQYQFYQQSLQQRKNQPFIVQIFHHETIKKRQFCSSTYSMTIYLHHVYGRLSEFKDIPFPDNLYCMIAMLQGYQKLYNKVGRFEICQEQVCIDQQGQIRVWLNSDLIKNFPQIEHYQPNKFIDEEIGMVDEIIEMIIYNTDQAEEPELKFNAFYQRQKMNRNNQVRFQQAKAIVRYYASLLNLEIPSAFESVLQMYKMEERNTDQDLIPNHGTNEDLPINSLSLPLNTRTQFQDHHKNEFPQPFRTHQNSPSKKLFSQNISPIVTNNRSFQPNPVRIVNEPKMIHPPQFLPPQINRVQMPIPTHYEQKIGGSTQLIRRQPINIQQFQPNQRMISSQSHQILTPTFHGSQQNPMNQMLIKSTSTNLLDARNHMPNKRQNEEKQCISMKNDNQHHNFLEKIEDFNEQENKMVEQSMIVEENQTEERSDSEDRYEISQVLQKNCHKQINISNLTNSTPLQMNYYCTVDEQHQLDPEIAADLLLYT